MRRRAFRTASRVCFGLVVLLFVAGCGCRKDSGRVARAKPPAVTIDRENPEKTVFEQVRAGAFQIAGVEATIEEALAKTRELSKVGDAELKGAIGELIDGLDAVGATLSDHTAEPAEVAKTPEAFAKMDDHRLASIAAANDALHELEDAAGMLGTLSQDPALANRPEVGEVSELLQLGIDDLGEAIRSLGGVVE